MKVGILVIRAINLQKFFVVENEHEQSNKCINK